MNENLKAIPINQIKLLGSIFNDRKMINRKYLMSLKNENLLQNHYFEAGIWTPWEKPDCHWGWESPNSSVRGHFLGHWLSAAAKTYCTTADIELKTKADAIVSELAICQMENGGEWAGPIPEKYLEWIVKGRNIGVPHYNIHKNLMGLWDMYKYAGNQQAFEILDKWADWFIRWTNNLTQEQMDSILEIETGGMLEIWADLYGITKKPEHYNLIKKYDRRQLFDKLIAGEDPLTNMHANTTIPEAIGAAIAFEVTGENRYKEITMAYWKCAVTDRGYFCTGGQTSGELWCPPNRQAARLGQKNQEHCTVYNMIRLAEILFKWTGNIIYSDYIERNLYNGILAQQNQQTGMPAYYLPLEPGASKSWGTPAESFWCCHGSVVQAQSSYESYIAYTYDHGIFISQYIPSEIELEISGVKVIITQNKEKQSESLQTLINHYSGPLERPVTDIQKIIIKTDIAKEFELKIRIPWWTSSMPEIIVNGSIQPMLNKCEGYYCIKRLWKNDIIELHFPKQITSVSLPDMPEMKAFMEGPVVLAGICDNEKTIYGDVDKLQDIFRPFDERHFGDWHSNFITRGQEVNIKFIPLYNVTDEKYTTYFNVRMK